MAYIFRTWKYEIPILGRVYCNNDCHQRYRSTYYEVLRISPNATQKEIKDAFIKLSKEMHPDSGNKGNHGDFVLLNEAYTILCKPRERQKYDTILRYQEVRKNNSLRYNHEYAPNDFERAYKYTKEWEELRKGNPYNRLSDVPYIKMKVAVCLIVLTIMLSVEMSMIANSFVNNKQKPVDRSTQYQLDYQETKKNAKSVDEQIDHILELCKKYKLGPYTE